MKRDTISLPFKVAAEWTDDCQGKKDFDGPLLRVSTRYWPPAGQGGGMLVENGRVKSMSVPYRSDGRASAASSIVLYVRSSEGYGEPDYIDLARRKFVGDTEEEVKRKVEAWVGKTTTRIVRVLAREFRLRTITDGR